MQWIEASGISLEDPDTRRFAEEDPRGFLKGIEGGAIVDEIQRAPQIPTTCRRWSMLTRPRAFHPDG